MKSAQTPAVLAAGGSAPRALHLTRSGRVYGPFGLKLARGRGWDCGALRGRARGKPTPCAAFAVSGIRAFCFSRKAEPQEGPITARERREGLVPSAERTVFINAVEIVGRVDDDLPLKSGDPRERV